MILSRPWIFFLTLWCVQFPEGAPAEPTSMENTVTELKEQVKKLEDELNDVKNLAQRHENAINSTDSNLVWLSRSDIPVGSVIAYAGKWPPTASNDPLGQHWTEDKIGWMLCDGRPIPSGSEYDELRKIVGNLYNNETNGLPSLPDYRGYFLRMVDNDAGRDPGRILATEQKDDLKSHDHPASSTSSISPNPHGHDYSTQKDVPGWGWGIISVQIQSNPHVVKSHQEKVSHTQLGVETKTTIEKVGGTETRPKNIAVNYIIRTKSQPVEDKP